MFRWCFDEKVRENTKIRIFAVLRPVLESYETCTQWVIGETTKAPREKARRILHFHHDFIISGLGCSYPARRGDFGEIAIWRLPPCSQVVEQGGKRQIAFFEISEGEA